MWPKVLPVLHQLPDRIDSEEVRRYESGVTLLGVVASYGETLTVRITPGIFGRPRHTIETNGYVQKRKLLNEL